MIIDTLFRYIEFDNNPLSNLQVKLTHLPNLCFDEILFISLSKELGSDEPLFINLSKELEL